MKMPRDNVVVLSVAGAVARVHSETHQFDAALADAGFQRDGDKLTRPVSNDLDRQNLVRFLIGIGALFSSGRDWSPEELVEYYKENGFTNQSYRVISWTGPDEYIVAER